MTISFSCLYWLPEALPVLKLFLCSPSFAPRFLSVGREPMAAVVDMWICLMQGLWFFFFFFIWEADFSFPLFDSIAGVWTCEGDPYRVFQRAKGQGRYSSTFSSGVPFLIFPFPDSSSFRSYILMSANIRALFVILSLCPPLGIKGAVVSARTMVGGRSLRVER